ncbi:MAG: hypothetical protein KF874_02730 [Rhizobiaceae bacterium]|nr:hypothetical protein [Rhizobiaceae bacterium]
MQDSVFPVAQQNLVQVEVQSGLGSDDNLYESQVFDDSQVVQRDLNQFAVQRVEFVSEPEDKIEFVSQMSRAEMLARPTREGYNALWNRYMVQPQNQAPQPVQVIKTTHITTSSAEQGGSLVIKTEIQQSVSQNDWLTQALEQINSIDNNADSLETMRAKWQLKKKVLDYQNNYMTNAKRDYQISRERQEYLRYEAENPPARMVQVNDRSALDTSLILHAQAPSGYYWQGLGQHDTLHQGDLSQVPHFGPSIVDVTVVSQIQELQVPGFQSQQLQNSQILSDGSDSILEDDASELPAFQNIAVRAPGRVFEQQIVVSKIATVPQPVLQPVPAPVPVKVSQNFATNNVHQYAPVPVPQMVPMSPFSTFFNFFK